MYYLNEIPTGTIDGVNKTFTTADTLYSIAFTTVDGAIYTGTVTIIGNTFVLADAPTASITISYYTDIASVPVTGATDTAQALIDDIRVELQIDKGKNIWTDNELLRYLNEGINDIYSVMNFKFEYKDGVIATLADGLAKYPKPSDLRKVLWTKLVDKNAVSTEADEEELVNVTDILASFQENRDMDLEGDKPQYFYIEGDYLWLYPIPNTTAAAGYTVKYKYSQYPDKLELTDRPAFSVAWQHVLNWYVKYRAWDKLPGKETQAMRAYDQYDMWKRKASADMADIQNEGMQYYTPVLPFKRRK